MEKTKNKKVIALGFCILAILVVLFILSFFIPIYPEICGKNEYTGQKECSAHYISVFTFFYIGNALEAHSGALVAIATIAIGGFTWRLWVSTDSLWRAGEKQASISNIAAMAAQKSVENLLATERPHKVMAELKVYGITSPDEKGTVNVSLEYEMVNYGRSPAFLSETCTNYIIASHLPPEFTYEDRQATRHIVSVNSGYGTFKPCEIKVVAGKIKEILLGESHFYVIGYVRYDDSSRHQAHCTRYCYKMIFDGNTNTSVRFEPAGPDSYWEYT